VSPGDRRIGLALAGGGPEGSVYELGALYALEESLEGVSLDKDVDIYVGVSAGAFIAACLANGIPIARLCRAIVAHEPGEHPFHPSVFFSPAIAELVRGGVRLPWLAVESLLDYLRAPEEQTLVESLMRLSRALPVGLFRNEPIRRYLQRILSLKNRTDDFRKLRRRLVVVATDLDSGEAARFGTEGLDHVPISTAVQASTALPVLYPPVFIDGRYYLDGVLLKTLHASVALDERADLLVCINPIVPVDTAGTVEQGFMRRGKLVHRGLPSVMSQTFRTLIYSRLQAGLASYTPRYPGQDVLLIEPGRDDYKMFFGNTFRFSSRKQVCEHAYESVRAQLLGRREELEPMLARHGIRLRTELLEDPTRNLWRSLGFQEPRARHFVADSLDGALTRLERVLQSREAASSELDRGGNGRSERLHT